VFAASAAYAQNSSSPANSIVFEAASVKAVGTIVGVVPMGVKIGIIGGPGTGDPGRIVYNFLPLRYLISLAYDVPNLMISGPDWLGTEDYVIEAIVPPVTTRDQLKLMLRSLLAERFGLILHRETRDVPAFILEIASTRPAA
jgi:uncharacterized protein (TIGR03435 family)